MPRWTRPSRTVLSPGSPVDSSHARDAVPSLTCRRAKSHDSIIGAFELQVLSLAGKDADPLLRSLRHGTLLPASDSTCVMS